MDWFMWPMEGQAGLIVTDNDYGRRTQYAHFHDGKWMLDNSLRTPKVLAWMPVPQLE